MEFQSVRPPAVAGMFFPGMAAVLGEEVADMLAAVPPEPTLPQPKAIIVPHAGYIYSGPVAASAYAQLAPHAATIHRVVLLGPCHRVAVRGLAVPHAAAFATPLGSVPLDQEAIALARTLPQVIHHDGAHAEEHSLEVQLPFLQKVLGDFSLVPFAVGYATPDEVAQVLELLWGGPETLIVISSDLSHYHSYARPRTGLRCDADQWPDRGRRTPRPAAAPPRPAQLRRHGGRQVARGRLRELRVP
jgi:hypothetical protein